MNHDIDEELASEHRTRAELRTHLSHLIDFTISAV